MAWSRRHTNCHWACVWTNATLATCLLLGLFTPSHAQEERITRLGLRVPDSIHVQELVTEDGSILVGRITEIGPDSVRFQTTWDETTIPISAIREITELPLQEAKRSRHWFTNPNATRLYFAPTARMLRRGTGYFADYYLFFPAVAYGITDNITIGGGISIFPWVDVTDQIFYFTPKVGLKATRSLHLAAGALVLRVPDWDDWDDDDAHTVGIAYGVVTAGTADASLTAGLGYGFAEGKLADKPAAVFGGELRFSRRAGFVSENWLFPGADDPLISYGLRFSGGTISVDLAFIRVLDDDEGDTIGLGIPYVDFVFGF